MLGIATIIEAPTLSPKVSDTRGTVTVIILLGSVSPLIAIARLIGSTVPAGSVGTEIFPWNST